MAQRSGTRLPSAAAPAAAGLAAVPACWNTAPLFPVGWGRPQPAAPHFEPPLALAPHSNSSSLCSACICTAWQRLRTCSPCKLSALPPRSPSTRTLSVLKIHVAALPALHACLATNPCVARRSAAACGSAGKRPPQPCHSPGRQASGRTLVSPSRSLPPKPRPCHLSPRFFHPCPFA